MQPGDQPWLPRWSIQGATTDQGDYWGKKCLLPARTSLIMETQAPFSAILVVTALS